MSRLGEMGKRIEWLKCVWCGKQGRMNKHGKPERYCDDEVIKVFRVKCGKCRKTFRVLPEFVVKHWWHHLLHNQSAFALKAALLFRPRVVTTSVPFHLKN